MESLDMDDVDQVVEINCGGVVFQTYKSTLTRGSTYFKSYFSGKFQVMLDKKDRFFLDFDPDWFRVLLNRLRYPNYKFPADPTGGLRNAADYLGIEWLPLEQVQRKEAEQKRQEELDIGKQLLLRLERGDQVEVRFHGFGIWRLTEFVGYDASQEAAWQFLNLEPEYSSTIIRQMNMAVDEVRITDPQKLAQILARAPSENRRFRISPAQVKVHCSSQFV